MKEKEIGLITEDIIEKWARVKMHLNEALYFFHIADSMRAQAEVRRAYELMRQIERELRTAPRVRIELKEE